MIAMQEMEPSAQLTCVDTHKPPYGSPFNSASMAGNSLRSANVKKTSAALRGLSADDLRGTA